MSYRKFSITNGKSQTKTLADPSVKIFLNNPSGLGESQALNLTQFGDVLKSDASLNFPTISGEIILWADTNSGKYKDYNDFVEFLSYEPLVLSYTIPKSTPETYTIDVALTQIQKSQTGTDSMLRCNFDLQGLSRWKGAEVTVTGSSASYSVVNNGQLPVGMLVTIVGSAMENPYFTLTQNSEVYGEGKFLGTFDKVIVNSNDGEQYVELEIGGSTLPNPLSYQDLSISNGAIYVTFVKVARGTSTLAVGYDSGSLTSVTAKFTPLYRSV